MLFLFTILASFPQGKSNARQSFKQLGTTHYSNETLAGNVGQAAFNELNFLTNTPRDALTLSCNGFQPCYIYIRKRGVRIDSVHLDNETSRCGDFLRPCGRRFGRQVHQQVRQCGRRQNPHQREGIDELHQVFDGGRALHPRRKRIEK